MFEEQNTNVSENVQEDGFLAGLTADETADEIQETPSQTSEASLQLEPHDADAAAGDTEQAAAEEDLLREESTADQPQKEGEPFLELTYMGEKTPVNREEAVTLAQKGMNYDRVDQKLREREEAVARLEAELSAPRIDNAVLPLLRAYAKANGANVQTLVEDMMQTVKNAGVPIEQPTTKNYLREKAVEDWKAFFADYPEINDPRTQLPQKIWDRIGRGVTPVNAMVEYRRGHLEEQLSNYERREQTRQLNEENNKRAGGSMRSTAGNGHEDGFLAGLWGM